MKNFSLEDNNNMSMSRKRLYYLLHCDVPLLNKDGQS
jgi:hypothetical protein